MTQSLKEALLEKRADAGVLAGRVSSELMEELAGQITQRAIAKGQLHPKDEATAKATVMTELRRHERQLEAQNYRQSRMTNVPTTPGEIGASVGLGTGMTWAVPRLMNKFRNKPSLTPPPTVGEAAKASFGPGMLPITGAFELANLAMNPMADPKYQRGERSYMQSAKEGWKGTQERFGKSQEDVRNKYGLLGLPVQALHGILNPITGLAYAGTGIYDKLTGKEGGELITQADMLVDKACKQD